MDTQKIVGMGNHDGGYPRTFQAPMSNRLAIALLGIIFCVVGLLVAKAAMQTNSGLGWFLLAVAGGMGLLCVAAIFISGRITLYKDRIEQSGLFGTRELAISDIQGYRTRVVKSTTFIDIIPSRGGLRRMSISRKQVDNPAFMAWLNGLRNLDAEDQKAVEQEIEHDESLGATPEERKAKVAMLRKSALYLTYGYLAAIILWGVYPHPAWLAIAVPLAGPWIAIALVWFSGGNYTMLELDKATLLRKGSLAQLLYFPCITYYAAFRISGNGLPGFPLSFQQLLVPSVVGGLLMFAIVIAVSRGAKLKPGVLLFMWIPLVIYAGGSLTMLNGYFDHSDPLAYRLKVVEKHRTTGKGATNYFHVTSEDSSYDGDTTLTVSNSLYNAIDVDGIVCAEIHPGALGWKWESAGQCGSS